MFHKYRPFIIIFFILWTISSGFYATRLQFSFDFEQFFPKGDPDLEFFKSFIEEFETDDNFLLIAVENKPTVFDSLFLSRFHQYSLALRSLPYVENVQSLTMLRYPVKTPFGISTIPVIHRNKKELYEQDRQIILTDPRFVYNLINEKGDALVVMIKNKDAINLAESKELMNSLNEMNHGYGFQRIYMLGRADLQKELVQFQKKEIIRISIFSMILVTFILWILYRRPIGLAISLVSIGMGLIIFVGLMAMLGREFNALSALYPILLLIVGTSDVIHIQSKYIDELRKGIERFPAMVTTIKEIGLATLLTSTTTSIGFATLLTSRVQPIREFGINAALGVMIAYLTVILFTTSVMTYFSGDQISKFTRRKNTWDSIIDWFYRQSLLRSVWITRGSVAMVLIFLAGISLITTNYNISESLPRKERVTEDFLYFEREFAGFRPLEFAIEARKDYMANDFEVLQQVNKLEEYLLTIPEIKTSVSLATLYKSIERMKRGNTREAYQFPKTKSDFEEARRLIERSNSKDVNVLISKDNKKTRISSRILDTGADTLMLLGVKIDNWIEDHIDSTVIDVKRTGTGMILLKNTEYVKNSLFSGLLLAIIAVSFLMGILFMNWRILFIALIPNMLPLLLAGAIIGYTGIELEAGISIVFAIIFGIAVDDTIHFLSKFNIARRAGMDSEAALKTTFEETGKAIMFTTIILFFGFLLMLFSNNPLSITIGILISATLIGAFIFDLTLLPVLLRKYLKDSHSKRKN